MTELCWLIKLRWLMLVLQLAAVLTAHYGLGAHLRLLPLFAVLALMALFNGLSALRLQPRGRAPARELLIQLGVDLLGLSALLYLGGGALNPLMSLYLIPLAMGGLIVPRRYAGYLVLAAVSCSAFLLLVGRAEILPSESWWSGTADLATAVMWICFAASAVLMTHFVSGASQALRRSEERLAQAREDTLRDQHLVALGTLSTGIAHELGSPLGTMAVLLGDLVKRHQQDSELHEDLVLLKEQVYRCKDILSQLTRTTGAARAEARRATQAGPYLQDLLKGWQQQRPDSALRVEWRSAGPGPWIFTEQTLGQAILNLVNNAADASPGDLAVGNQALELDILDRGPGLSKAVLARLGKETVSSKPGGMGVGFLLADATIARLGGRIELSPRHHGGTRCHVTLPLEALSVETKMMGLNAHATAIG